MSMQTRSSSSTGHDENTSNDPGVKDDDDHDVKESDNEERGLSVKVILKSIHSFKHETNTFGVSRSQIGNTTVWVMH